MTRDDELIAEIRKLADCSKLVTAAERETIHDKIREYRDACKLSNGKDKHRNAAWGQKAFDAGRLLKSWFKVLTGRDYFDMKRFQRCDKCE
jgi:hypothetical protein